MIMPILKIKPRPGDKSISNMHPKSLTFEDFSLIFSNCTGFPIKKGYPFNYGNIPA